MPESRWEPYLNPRLHLLLFFLSIPPLASLLMIAGPAFKGRFRLAPALASAGIGFLLILQVLPSVRPVS